MRVDVQLGGRSYPVVIDSSGFGDLEALLDDCVPGQRVVLVTESTVGPLWSNAVRAAITGRRVDEIVLPAGESHKTVATWSHLVDQLLALRVDRNTPILALGGGVLGDIAGFAAASVLRGMPVVQLPTTLLSMVDSSVGGKTAVNHRQGKNLIGAFHQPSLVYAALPTLGTLSQLELTAGLGEVLKTAVIGSKELYLLIDESATSLVGRDYKVIARVIECCVRIKAQVVSEDEREQGRRVILNAGHTVGHGIEAALGFGTIPHGHAVALGLIAETAWATAAGLCVSPGLAEDLSRVASKLGLPVTTPEVDWTAMIAAMAVDKKADGSNIKLPVAVNVGSTVVHNLPASQLSALLEHCP